MKAICSTLLIVLFCAASMGAYSPFPRIGTGNWQGQDLLAGTITGPNCEYICPGSIITFTGTRATGDLDINLDTYALEMDQLKSGWPRWYCPGGYFINGDTGVSVRYYVPMDHSLSTLRASLFEDDVPVKGDDVVGSLLDIDGYGQLQAWREYKVFNITSVEVGRSPYPTLVTTGSPNTYTSFITSTETSCVITVKTNYAADWILQAYPPTWTNISATSASDTDTFTASATVPDHDPRATNRPENWTIRVQATVANISLASTSTQSATDKIRQMYVDHDIKVPPRDWFSGAVILLRTIVLSEYDTFVQMYRTWANNPSANLPINEGYRNPEYNETLQGSSWESVHQYGYAIDLSPIPDSNNPGRTDDVDYIEDVILGVLNEHYFYWCGGLDPHNALHVDWMDYDNLPF